MQLSADSLLRATLPSLLCQPLLDTNPSPFTPFIPLPRPHRLVRVASRYRCRQGSPCLEKSAPRPRQVRPRRSPPMLCLTDPRLPCHQLCSSSAHPTPHCHFTLPPGPTADRHSCEPRIRLGLRQRGQLPSSSRPPRGPSWSGLPSTSSALDLEQSFTSTSPGPLCVVTLDD